MDISVAEAEEFLKTHERHYKAPVEAICAIGVGEDDARLGPVVNGKIQIMLHGAAILGRRASGEAELAHIYCDGASQAYSLLYGACWRTLKALGYDKTWL